MRWASPGTQTETQPGDFFIYILTNARRTVLYIGITSDLGKRLTEHAFGDSKFTQRYHATMLLYFENFPDALQAIEREKQLKRWSRVKKLALICTRNPELRDLGVELFDVGRSTVEGSSDTVDDIRNPDLPRGPSTARRPPPAPARRSARDDRDVRVICHE
jgi:putative endonuclease